MKAKIKEKREVAKGTLLLKYDLLSRKISFKPGQYFYISIPKLFYPDSRGNLRHFTIVSSPNQVGIISMATRIREESGFKKTLKELPIGSEVEIGSIMGDFVLPEESEKQLVFIAGGIGITPFISMLTYINEESLSHEIILICSNRDKESTPFYEELQELVKINNKVKLIFTMTEKATEVNEKGRIDAELIKKYFSEYEKKLFYVAGPPEFNMAMLDILEKLNIKDIRVENFRGY